MQIVDAALERNGEVDEVGLAAAEQDVLRAADASQRCEARDAEEDGDGRGRGCTDRDPRCDGGADVHQPSVKKTV
jgi:hypothetical protein